MRSLSVFGAMLLSRLWVPLLLPSNEVIHSFSFPGPKSYEVLMVSPSSTQLGLGTHEKHVSGHICGLAFR